MIILKKLPSKGIQPDFLENLIKQIWPHRAKEIYQLFVEGASDIDASTDHPYYISYNDLPIGITGFYLYDETSVGLCWHGVIPSHRKLGLSKLAFQQICILAKKSYPRAQKIIELIPEDKKDLLMPYFKKLGFSSENQYATADYLPKNIRWEIFSYQIGK